MRVMFFLYSIGLLLGLSFINLQSGVDVRLKTYVTKYEQAFNRPVTNLSMEFMDLDMGRVAAFCRVWTFGKRELVFDIKYWNNISEKQRISLFFHEVGHCEGDLDHDESIKEDGYCPNSFMYPSVLSNECLNNHWDHYIKELDNKLNGR